MKTSWRASQYIQVPLTLAILAFNGGCFLIHKKEPYREPDRLMRVLKVNQPGAEEPVSGIDFLEWRSRSRALGPIAAYISRGINFTDEKDPERFSCGQVTVDFFPLLGVSPLYGRTFIPDEYRSGQRVVVLSYGLWMRVFNGDVNIIGKNINIDREGYTVIAVMPAGFQIPEDCELWIPLALDDDSLRTKDESFGLRVIARLNPGVTIDQAQDEMNTIARSVVKVISLNEAKRLYRPKPQSTTIHLTPK